MTSFAFGIGGRSYVSTLFDLRGNGTLSATTNGTAWSTWDTGVESFAFGPTGTQYVGELYDLRGNGTLSSNNSSGWVTQDTAVVAFAFGKLESAGYLVILSTSQVLEGTTSNVFQPWLTAIASFVVDTQTGAIDYVTTSGVHGVYNP